MAGGSTAGSETTAGLPNGLAARINVTVPLSALLGLSDLPAEVAAFGPVDAHLARDLVRAAGIHRATRWCVTVVGEDGQAVGHGCARGRHTAPLPLPPPSLLDNRDDTGPPGANHPLADHDPPTSKGDRAGPHGADSGPSMSGGADSGPCMSGPRPQHPALGIRAKEFMERLGIRVTPLAVGTCDHRNEESGYTPSRRLRHLTGARTATCTAPGCRRPAAQCDLDHTHALRRGRPDLRVQSRSVVPSAPSVQASSGVGAGTAPSRAHDLDRALGPPLHDHAHPLRRLTNPPRVLTRPHGRRP